MDGAFNVKSRRRRPTINITSLIDVMFLLLIFFMVSSSFKHQLGIDVALPPAVTAENQEVESHEIVVDDQGDFYFGQQKVDTSGLRRALEELASAQPESPVILRADRQADFGRVVQAMDIARDVGVRKLVVPTLSGDRPAPATD